MLQYRGKEHAGENEAEAGQHLQPDRQPSDPLVAVAAAPTQSQIRDDRDHIGRGEAMVTVLALTPPTQPVEPPLHSPSQGTDERAHDRPEKGQREVVKDHDLHKHIIAVKEDLPLSKGRSILAEPIKQY